MYCCTAVHVRPSAIYQGIMQRYACYAPLGVSDCSLLFFRNTYQAASICVILPLDRSAPLMLAACLWLTLMRLL